MNWRFTNRKQAGELLAGPLETYAGRNDVVIEALPRGGVPVGFELAQTLHLPLDVMVVRKIGVPHHPELAMGAVTADGTYVVESDVVDELQIDREVFAAALQRSLTEAKAREEMYRADRPQIPVNERTAIVVDDGIATGSTLRAAIKDLRARGAKEVVVAVPVAPADAAHRFSGVADRFVCLTTPRPFVAVGAHYDDFTQTTDAEVRTLLARAPQPQAA